MNEKMYLISAKELEEMKERMKSTNGLSDNTKTIINETIGIIQSKATLVQEVELFLNPDTLEVKDLQEWLDTDSDMEILDGEDGGLWRTYFDVEEGERIKIKKFDKIVIKEANIKLFKTIEK